MIENVAESMISPNPNHEVLAMTTAVAFLETRAPLAPALYTVQDIARLLQCSERNVRNLDYQDVIPGRCPVGRLVRWRVKDVNEWIASGCPWPEAK